MPKRTDIKDIRLYLDKMGYELLSETFISYREKLKIKCNKGHIYSMPWSSLKRGCKCAICTKNAKFDIYSVRVLFNKEGYKLLSTNYINSKSKLFYECPKGHRHSLILTDWNRGVRCPYCNGRPIRTLEEFKIMMEKERYELLSTEYVNNKTKMDYKCPRGHLHSINFSQWLRGARCPHCHGNAKKTIEFVKKDFESKGYNLLTDKYETCHGKLKTICPKGHIYNVSWDNWNHNESRCPKCSESGTSKQEISLESFISSFSSIISKDRILLKPKELDIVIPDKKLAVEYCGLYWHSEGFGKGSNYHIDKLNGCKEKGYRLITIFEDEFLYKQTIVESRLRSILSPESFDKIFARKCQIKEITAKEAKIFCEENHLQGYGAGSSIKLGLFHEDELVSVMTFAKPSISKGSKVKDGVWELHRFCSKLNTRIIGGASKLLKYFERSFEWQEIFSYADRRWSVGNLYEKIGFEFEKFTKPNYWYLPRGCKERIYRFQLRKLFDEPKDKTEWELRQEQGYDRIWDCGSIRYKKSKKDSL